MPGAAPLLRRLRSSVPTWALCAEGHWNQLRLAGEALAAAGPDREMLRAGLDLLLWGFLTRPLEPSLAGPLLALHGKAPVVPAGLLPALRALAALPPGTDDPAWPEWEYLRDAEDPAAAAGFLRPRLADPGSGLAWLGRAWDCLAGLGAWDHLADLLAAADLSGPLAPLASRLAAEIAMYREGPEAARAALLALDPALWGPWREQRAARCAQLAGDLESARSGLAAAHSRLPWHPNLLLVRHALARPLPAPPVPTDARAAVGLYSWNNAARLGPTLEALEASDLGPARVLLLDNGSGDDTAALLAAAAGRLGRDRAEVVRLPVNVGAPAARNWLLALPAARDADWVAFVDDDALPPRDWLGRMLAAGAAHPATGAVGSRIVDAARPSALQSVDVHLMPPPAEGPHIEFLDGLSGLPDAGLYDYVRPCLSVTGCLHLLRRSALDAAGAFDIRFSPSQLDDFERDLRAFLAGIPCLYLGTLAVRHHQASAQGLRQSPARQGNARGNLFKLSHLHPRQNAARAAARDLDLAWDDLLAKAEELETP
ncbi:MAG: glycosyltransferase [Thermodesulfobacteriota bacterium]